MDPGSSGVADADAVAGALDESEGEALVGFLEVTAQAGLLPHLEAEQTTVGVLVNIRHLAATPVGMKLHSRAELLAVDRRRLTFRVQAWDEVELISEGEHVRFIIDVPKFLDRVGKKGK